VFGSNKNPERNENDIEGGEYNKIAGKYAQKL
jgi:hypothetical protein